MKITFPKNITYTNLAVLTLALLFILSCFKFIQSSMDLVEETNRNNFTYTVKVRDTIEEIDKIIERAESNLKMVEGVMLLTYDTSKLYDGNYNTIFTNRINKLIKSTMINSPGIDGAWFQFNINTPNAYENYCWFRKKNNKIVDLKKYFFNTDKYIREITPESDPYYFEAVEHKTTTWSDIYTDIDIQTKMITISIPVYKNNVLIGVIGVDLSVKNIENILSKMQQQLTDSEIFLLDKNEQIILSTKKEFKHEDYEKSFSPLLSKDAKTKEATTQYKYFGKKYTAILIKLSNKYSAVISFPDSTIYKGYERLFRTTDAIFILLIMLSAIVAYNMQKIKRINRKLIDEAKKLKTIFEASPNILLMKDSEGKYIWCNERFCETMGIKQEEIIGKNATDVFPPDIVEKIKMIDKTLKKTKKTYIDEECSLNRKGEIICLRKHFVPIINSKNELTSTLIIAVDITKEREEKELLKTAKEAAEKATEMKSNFLANMSHEIRTPLNGILGFMQLLQDTDTTSEQAEFISDAQKSSELLLNIINDILDFSKMEADKLRIESISFDVRSLVEDITTLSASQAQNKNLELSSLICSDVPQKLIGDPGRIKQILMNLTNNAIKFTESGEVTIFLKKVSEDPENATLDFAVVDTGIGIERDKLELIFKAFEQGDASTTRKFGGTGLGLAICKKLITLMNGSIEVKSELGLGSSFNFQIPFKKDETEIKTNQQNNSTKNLEGTKILVATSNKTDLKIIKYYLNEAKCDVKEVQNSSELIKKLEDKNEFFESIIIDAKLQNEELLQSLKENVKNSKLILYTGLARRGDSAIAREHGFNGYLTKPFKKHELLETLTSIKKDSDIFANNELITKHVIKEQRFNEKGKVLVVEDSDINCKLIQKILKKYGLYCEIARNGAEAVNAFSPNKYSLILMDWQMPVLDGGNATKQIREIEKNSNTRVPIVALTANASTADEEKCYEFGMDDYISKPINLEKLQNVIEKHLKIEQSSPQIENNPELILWQIMSELEFTEKEALEFFAQYLEILPLSINELEYAIDEENYDKVKNISHQLKGSSSTLRIEKISELSRELENCATKKDKKQCAGLINQIKTHCEELDALLSNIIRTE